MDQLGLLESKIDERPAVVALQEISEQHHAGLRARFPSDRYACTLDLRPPRRYDGLNRKLGCGLLAFGDAQMHAAALVPDTPLPERALAASVRLDGAQFLAGSFHAVTGVGYKQTKPIMFQALTRFLEERSDDVIFGIDRNAPKVDRFPLSEAEWWWPRPNEEPLLFGQDAPHSCRDVFHRWLKSRPHELARITSARPDGPLAVTHRRGPTRVPSRYDAIYASPAWEAIDVEHDFGEQVEGLSDHGIVIADLDLQE